MDKAKLARVEAVVPTAVGVAWDECHKIYVLMDEAQMELMESYEYDPLLRITDGDDGVNEDEVHRDDVLWLLSTWYDASCILRFISAVRTVEGDPNDGFESLVPQFADTEGD